ncbi:phosphatase 2C 6 [Micractinium conductrix]|uniref:protein-serine/threonine phosphatase n=1 Tax=Micractinium conductrix TaxID=554055 RepID=A0A2P6VS31_9CHLO|nr:phosphatase 2C 6 [Micractinium conductrix]|eukprot:PSC76899.1 phosphatase 2C 6 [Micractinium conductrix]
MPHFRLAALSARAQEFRGGEGGGSDLRLPLDRPTRIGRAVGNDVQLPANWIQISSNHCSLLYDTEQEAWVVTDTSTNGTFVNGIKIGKGKAALLRPNDRLQLSVVDRTAPNNQMEYVLQRFEGSPENANSAVQQAAGAAPAGAAPPPAAATPKRKQPSGAAAAATAGSAPPASASKRSRTGLPGAVGAGASPAPAAAAGVEGREADGSGTGAEVSALFQLRQENGRLIRELEAEKQAKGQLESSLREAQAAAKAGEQRAAAAAAAVKEAAAAQRAAESLLAQARSRETSLQLELEGASAASRAKEADAAAAAAAAAEERSRREQAEASVAALEAQLAAAKAEVLQVAAAQAAESAAAQAAAQERQEGRQEAERRAAELAAQLEEVEAAAEKRGAQLEHAQKLMQQERGAREALEQQLQHAQEAADEARRQIASLEARERRLQNDRLVIDGCLAALQHNNKRSHVASERLASAFRELQDAKHEVDRINEEQAQQCSDICVRLAANSSAGGTPAGEGLEEEGEGVDAGDGDGGDGDALAAAAAAFASGRHTPLGLLLAETQQAVLPAFLAPSPMGTVPLTVPAVGAALDSAGAELPAAAQEQQEQQQLAGTAPEAEGSEEEGDEQMEEEAAEEVGEEEEGVAAMAAEAEQQAEEPSEAMPQQDEEEEEEAAAAPAAAPAAAGEEADVEMEEATEEAEEAAAVSRAVAAAAVAAAAAEADQGAVAVGSTAASTPEPAVVAAAAAAGQLAGHPVVVEDSEEGEAAEEEVEEEAAEEEAAAEEEEEAAAEEDGAAAAAMPGKEAMDDDVAAQADLALQAAAEEGEAEGEAAAQEEPAAAAGEQQGGDAAGQASSAAAAIAEGGPQAEDFIQLSAEEARASGDEEAEGDGAGGGGGADSGDASADAGAGAGGEGEPQVEDGTAGGGWPALSAGAAGGEEERQQLGGSPAAAAQLPAAGEADVAAPDEAQAAAEEGQLGGAAGDGWGGRSQAREPAGPAAVAAGEEETAGEEEAAGEEEERHGGPWENDASQGNVAPGTQDETLRSLSKGAHVPESEQQESRSAAASGGGAGWIVAPPRFAALHHRAPPAAAGLRAAAAASLRSPRRAGRLLAAAQLGSAAGTPSAAARLAPADAHAASLSRTRLSWSDLLPELAHPGQSFNADEARARLQHQLEGSTYEQVLEEECDVCGPSAEVINSILAEWEAVEHQRPAGFDAAARLALPGVADAAVESRGGRYRGYWKGVNQDAFTLSQAGEQALLVGVCDGHGSRGEKIAAAAADGVAAAVREGLRRGADPQAALVAAFNAVAASLEHRPEYEQAGAAAAFCLLTPGGVTAAWAGDCRAVLGLSLVTPSGPRCLVHALTTDHKPGSPLERARIAATGRARVIQAQRDGPMRLTAPGIRNSLSLSRGFGDSWAVPLGLTAEPDTLQLTLPPPAAFATAAAPASSTSTSSSPLDTVGSSVDASFDEASSSPSSTRQAQQAQRAGHVLVVGCDGVWDMMSNTEAVGLALGCDTAQEAAHLLTDTVRRRWAARWGGQEMDDVTVTWIFVVGVFLSILVGYGLGANDVANTFGPSVGAKALTIRQAILVAAVFEFLGARC